MLFRSHAVASLPVAEAVETLREREHRSLDRASGEARARHGRVEPGVKEGSPVRFAGREARKGSGSSRVDGGRHLAARPGSAEEMPGTTHPRRSSDDDEGVGVGRVGGDREGRVSADPSGSEGARSERSPWRGGFTGEWAVSGTKPFTPLDAPCSERSAEERKRGTGGAHCASGVG